MLFHSQLFLVLFLPPVLLIYYAIRSYPRPRRWLLIVASLVFYGYWDARLLPLLFGSVLANWLLARWFYTRDRRWAVGAGVTLNLAVLAVFKYADFFADSLAAITGIAHQPWSIILPLGISFFTFQQISYLVDLKRGGAPRYRFDDYAMYVTFFPQLIAGPIVRHNEIIYQYELDPVRPGLYERLSQGLVLLTIGLVKKAFIADRVAVVADAAFARATAGEAMTTTDAWAGTTAFGLQIYFDFSGYSDMAIGLALMFGLSLPYNFNAPYRAASVREFWRCWHMTLSRFLRDYLYIPLGGNREGAVRHVAALMITMLLGGLWHGAGWTFIAWGGLHGVALGVNHLWRQWNVGMPRFLAWTLTIVFVFLCWVLFRAESFAAAAHIYTAIAAFGDWSYTIPDTRGPFYMLLAAAICLFGVPSQRLVLERLLPNRAVAAAVAVLLMYMVMHVGAGQNQEFIYFQF